jgi:hypothetical protein
LSTVKKIHSGQVPAPDSKSLKEDLILLGTLVLAKEASSGPVDNATDSRLAARLVSQDLMAFSETVGNAAATGSKQFFIYLGKYLSGELKNDMWDRLDVAVLRILFENPSIAAKDAVRELKERGGWTLTEDHFRMRKKRLRFAERLASSKEKSLEA